MKSPAEVAFNRAHARADKRFKRARDCGAGPSRLKQAWDTHQRTVSAAWAKYIRTVEGR